MRTFLQVLSENERDQVHQRTLEILGKTGVRVDTEKGRQILKEAGAEVDENTRVVRFPRTLVEESLQLAPKEFALGARRPGWDLQMNAGECVLLADGEGVSVIDRKTGEHRASTYNDWLEATRMIDALDSIGVYWSMTRGRESNGTAADLVRYWRNLFRNFSKHVQDSVDEIENVPWLLEVLQVIFGDKETIRKRHPFSFLVCPQSPLVIEGQYTDAYLELLGWDVPIAVMPMPLRGGTAPGSMISTVILGNCEVLAMLCLVQAGSPGTPFLYAPVLATMNPRTGLLSSGAIESGLMGAAETEMARYYGLPVEASGGGTDHFIPGIQATYEKAMNALLPALSWPDILVGPGLLGGSMILSLEQLLIDVEVFEMSKHAHQGIVTREDNWLDDVIQRIGPAGNFLGERSTIASIRSDEWYISKLGVHGPMKRWEAAGRPTLLEEARAKVEQVLKSHQPLPFSEEVERELRLIQQRAKASV